MAIRRYSRTPILNFGAQFGTSQAREQIQAAIKNGTIQGKKIVLRGSERLDTMAGVIYGDGSLWWILAAASNIGWGLQVPPGTVLTIPSLGQIAAIIG